MRFLTSGLKTAVSVIAVFLSVAILVGFLAGDVNNLAKELTIHSAGASGIPKVVLLQNLDSEDQDKQNEAAALFHLAGGKKMLKTNTPDQFGDKELEHKNEDALKILSQFFHSSHSIVKEKGPNSKKLELSSHRGRIQSHHVPNHPPNHPVNTADDSQQSAPSPSESSPENKELQRMKMRSEVNESLESPNEALQGLIAGWSGAGWWQPCAEVCRPTAGTKHTKANFQIYTECEQKCRATKTEKLKEVMQHIRGSAEAAAGHKEIAPRTIQKLSKFLLKWAEANGLPASVAADANTNLADNEQAGESISGMLIAGWSGAGWWKPCGEVCRPGPGTPHTKANFDKFMACESACRKSKAEYLHGFLSPKAAVKALAHAKQHARPAPTAPTAAAPASSGPAAAPAQDRPSPHPESDRHRLHAAAVHSARVKAAAAAAAAAHVKAATAALPTAAASSPATGSPAAGSKAVAKPHLTKYQKLIQWAEAHGLPKKLADNPADKLKVPHGRHSAHAGWTM